MARTTEQVYRDHMDALTSGNAEKLIGDYADDALLLTLGGEYVGKQGVAAFLQASMEAFPNLVFTEGSCVISGNTVLVTWSGDSDVAKVEHGVDTFVIRDDKIRIQTVWFTPPVPK